MYRVTCQLKHLTKVKEVKRERKLTHDQKLLPEVEIALTEFRRIHSEDRREEPQWQLSPLVSIYSPLSHAFIF
jgi:hypothetical protein